MRMLVTNLDEKTSATNTDEKMVVTDTDEEKMDWTSPASVTSLRRPKPIVGCLLLLPWMDDGQEWRKRLTNYGS